MSTKVKIKISFTADGSDNKIYQKKRIHWNVISMGFLQ